MPRKGLRNIDLQVEEGSEIESLKLGRSKHFFINPCFSVKEKIWLSINRNQNIQNILNLIGTSAGQYSQKDLTQLTGNSKSLISYYVKILRLKGIIEVENHKIRISEDFTTIDHDYFFENA